MFFSKINRISTRFIKGHDTTATAMSWFLYCIARNPEEQV
jgi:cytochrome P450